jgi:selenide,water dikinase
MVGEETIAKVTNCMATLNKKASELMQEVGVHACSDITGFGLLGHASQIAENSQVGIELRIASIPYFPEVIEFSQRGFCPAGLCRNRDYYSNRVKFESEIPDYMQNILFDVQTSGGLLISVGPEKADLLLDRLRQAGVKEAAIIGEVISKPRGMVTLK